jgi:hypothetical protein
MAYWKDYPPTHVLVAAYLMGGKRKPAGNTQRVSDGTFVDLKQAVSWAGGSVVKKLPQFYKA